MEYDDFNNLIELDSKVILPSSTVYRRRGLESIDDAFRTGHELNLPPVIVFTFSDGSLVTYDGNNRLVKSLEYQRPICGVIIGPGESRTFPYLRRLLDHGVVSYDNNIKLVQGLRRCTIDDGINTYEDLLKRFKVLEKSV